MDNFNKELKKVINDLPHINTSLLKGLGLKCPDDLNERKDLLYEYLKNKEVKDESN